MSEEIEEFARRQDEYLRAAASDSELPPVVDFPATEVTGLLPDPMAFVRFGGTTFTEAQMSSIAWNLEVVDFRATDSTFVKVDMYDSSLTDGVFERCNFMRCDMASSVLRNVRFVDCNLEQAAFTRATLDNVTFERCRFKNTHFVLAKMHNTIFTEPDFDGPIHVEAKGAYLETD